MSLEATLRVSIPGALPISLGIFLMPGSITFYPPLPIFRAEQIQQHQSFLTRFARVPSPTSPTHPNFTCQTDLTKTKKYISLRTLGVRNRLTLSKTVADNSVLIPFKEALLRLENRRVRATRPLIPPQILQEELPLYAWAIAPWISTDLILIFPVGPWAVSKLLSGLGYNPTRDGLILQQDTLLLP